ncbi:MAG: hypothetical protein QXP42_02405 [Candidatus Micrarchaeia archaeon]
MEEKKEKNTWEGSTFEVTSVALSSPMKKSLRAKDGTVGQAFIEKNVGEIVPGLGEGAIVLKTPEENQQTESGHFGKVLISTAIDALIQLIQKRGRVEVEEAAGELEISPITLEEWARLLEKEGKIKIEYQLTKLYLVWMGKGSEKVVGVGEAREKREILNREISSMFERMSSKEKELIGMQQDFDKITRMIDPRLERMRRRMDAIKELEKENERIYAERLAMLEKMNRKVGTIVGKIEVGEGRLLETLEIAERVGTRLKALESEVKKLPEMRKHAEKIEAEIYDKEAGIKKKIREYDALVGEIGRIRATTSLIENEVEQTKKMKVEIEKMLSEITESYNRVKESLVDQEDVYAKIIGVRDEIKSIREDTGKLWETVNEVYKGNKILLGRVRDMIKDIEEQEMEYRLLNGFKDNGTALIRRYEAFISDTKRKYEQELANLEKAENFTRLEMEESRRNLGRELEEIKGVVKSFEALLKKKEKIEEGISRMQEERKMIVKQVERVLVEVREDIAGSKDGTKKMELIKQKIEGIKAGEEEFNKKYVALKESIEDLVATSGTDNEMNGE